MRLKGKNAIVTGSARGLGASIAADLAREGARVMLCDVLDDLGREVAASIGEAAAFRRMDVTRSDEWAEAIAAAEAAFGSVDVLVNNAAMVEFATFDELTEEVFKSVFEVNAIGTFLGMKAVVPAMRRAGGGSIVNISSTAGVHSSGGARLYGIKVRGHGAHENRGPHARAGKDPDQFGSSRLDEHPADASRAPGLGGQPASIAHVHGHQRYSQTCIVSSVR